MNGQRRANRQEPAARSPHPAAHGAQTIAVPVNEPLPRSRQPKQHVHAVAAALADAEPQIRRAGEGLRTEEYRAGKYRALGGEPVEPAVDRTGLERGARVDT